MKPSFFTASNDDELAYHHYERNKSLPTIVFLGGFMSDMSGTKATKLDKFCEQNNYSFLRLDYHGHGQSSGEFIDGTIGRWAKGAIELIDEVTSGKLLIIGSSMGGWIMLHAALDDCLKDRLHSLIGIAPAPDFTEDLMWKDFSDKQQASIERDGVVYLDNCYEDGEPYPITKELIDDGKEQCLLKTSNKLDITCPVRLLHGMADIDVPWQVSSQLADKLASNDVQIHYLKDADHRMSSPKELELLENAIIKLTK